MSDTLFSICFLKKFNNYFNRKIIGYETLAEYQTAVGNNNYFIPLNKISFDPKDNVSTEIIMNDCPFDPDYCLLLDDDLEIVSRWFVMETIFTRKKQYKHSLRRDVIFDNLDNLLDSPVFVQKGWLKDSDPFIFNPEGMSFNEIKSNEVLLKDKTEAAYLVGYIAKNAAASDVSISIPSEQIQNYFLFENIVSDTGIPASTLADLFNFGQTTEKTAEFANEVELLFKVNSNDLIPIPFLCTLYFNTDWSARYVGSDNASGNINVPSTSTKTALVKVNKNMIQGATDHVNNVMSILKNEIISRKITITNQMSTILQKPYLTADMYNKLSRYNNKLVKYGGQIYTLRIHDTTGTTTDTGNDIYSNFGSGLTSAVNAAKYYFTAMGYTSYNNGQLSIVIRNKCCHIQLLNPAPEQVPNITTKISSNRNHLSDEAFDMFVIPFNAGEIIDSVSGVGVVINYSQNLMKIVSEIIKELDASCYDIQLLPYYPDQENISTFGGNKYFIDTANMTEDVDFNYLETTIVAESGTIDLTIANGLLKYKESYGVRYVQFVYPLIFGYLLSTTGFSITYTIITGDLTEVSYSAGANTSYPGLYGSFYGATGNFSINSGDENDIVIRLNYTKASTKAILNAIFWPKKNKFSVDLDYTLESTESFKIDSECDKYRLVSPNYQGAFDFNLAKNGGKVDFFIADCTYKPYTPYIKVAPSFNYLYGQNFGDCRGLICGGDFSMPRFTSAWESFELQNKNYQNIFNREIQNLDFTQNMQFNKQALSATIGAITSGIGGAGAGAMATGSPYGAIGGAAAGGVLSGLAAGIDLAMLSEEQKEARSLAIDKYNYQLGNIKALPYTLTKVGAFNINSKVFPFLEYYTCTEKEKEALRQKIKYESMTVMRIDKFGDYYRIDTELRYFKGELIRNEDIAEDNHVFEAIYYELLKGVFM